MNLNKFRGFTLIELIIVMSIVALLVAIVGPMTMNSLEKAQAKSELLVLKSWIKKVSYRAYISGQQLDLIFKDNKVVLKLKATEQVIKNHDFEYIHFQPQTLRFNNKGFVSPALIAGLYRDTSLTLDLSKTINSDYGKKSED